tara:strand:+ start:975 stop:1229 length:255 start_codon:yes stop_codon:yes gene_type:complete
MEDIIERIELIDLITDCIEMSIPYIIVLDNQEREVVLYLPTPQSKGTEYQKMTYALVSAKKVVESFFSLEQYTEEIEFYNPEDN